jgi:hypothetical protein
LVLYTGSGCWPEGWRRSPLNHDHAVPPVAFESMFSAPLNPQAQALGASCGTCPLRSPLGSIRQQPGNGEGAGHRGAGSAPRDRRRTDEIAVPDTAAVPMRVIQPPAICPLSTRFVGVFLGAAQSFRVRLPILSSSSRELCGLGREAVAEGADPRSAPSHLYVRRNGEHVHRIGNVL